MAIEKLKGHKSPGIDQISAEVIKAGGRTICSEIHKLINCIWNEEELPEEWKESIIPIYKKGDKMYCHSLAVALETLVGFWPHQPASSILFCCSLN